MSISSEVNDSTKIIRISGAIKKSDFLELKREFNDSEDYEKILVDLSATELVTSSFINLLIELKMRDPQAVNRIKLLNPNNIILEVLYRTRIDKIFEILKKNDLV